ncbi:MAG: AzlD domain-containing protein [Clostridiaceae bacterium]|nr:AzlD domain-containing protein [Clostridiaceae bacterium]
MSMVVLRVAIMAIVTYLLRVAPFLLFKKPIKNRWMQSFLYYVPYAVLMAMTVPDMFLGAGSVAAGIAGFIVAAILGWCRANLLTVAMAASATVWVVNAMITSGWFV